jgi:hypothetical protein
MQGRQLVPVETDDKHTPPDPRTRALANAHAHGEDLRQRWQHQPPPVSVHPRCNSELNARNVASAGAPVKSSRPSSQTPTTPRSLRELGRTSLPQRCSCATYPSCRPSTAGAPPQHPDVGGACRRATGGKLRVTPPTRGLLPSAQSGGGGAD